VLVEFAPTTPGNNDTGTIQITTTNPFNPAVDLNVTGDGRGGGR
jgi:hypothetical protein